VSEGTRTDPPLGLSRNELADNGARDYAYRVNGYLVRSYGSQNGGASKVDDGNAQLSYVSNGQLTANGDRLGDGCRGTVTIGVNAAGGACVSLNGEVVSFEHGRITPVVVNTGAGNESALVNSKAAGVPLTINEGGNDVSVGAGVQGILGAVSSRRGSTRATLIG
jgi:hypothetical protein